MIVRFRSTGFTACIALGLAVLWSVADAFPRGLPSEAQESQLWIQEGKRLYESGEYEEAVQKLLEGLRRAKAKEETADARFYLSLSYYALDRVEDCRNELDQLLAVQPDRTIDERFYAAGFVELFQKAKAEKLGARPPAPAKPQVAVKEAPKKTAGGKNSPG